MALGTITLKNLEPQLGNSAGTSGEVAPNRWGSLLVSRATVVGDSSYPTGGSVLTPAQLGFGSEGVILAAMCFIQSSTGSNNAAVEARYDDINQKLQCFASTDAAGCPVAEVANATNLSGITWNVIALGYPALP